MSPVTSIYLGVDIPQVGAHGGDAAVFDQDVADEVTQVRVDGEHVPTPQEQPVGHGRHLPCGSPARSAAGTGLIVTSRSPTESVMPVRRR